MVARLGRDQGSPERRLASLKNRESQQSKWVVGEDLMISKHSKEVVFPISLTRKANSTFRETRGREAELVGVSSGFAVHSRYSSSSGMVGSCQQMGMQCWYCCVGVGDARPGAVVVPFHLSPSHSPAPGFLGCAACREHQLPCRNSSS